MNDPVMKQLCEKTIGELVVRYLDTISEGEIASLAERGAVDLVCQISEVLDDLTLDDTECFQHIDSIVSAFHHAGLSTQRHRECE